MVMAALAWNLKAWFGLLLPEKGRWASKYKTEKQAVIRMEFKSFVNAFIRVPAQIIRQGRKTIYRLLAWNPWCLRRLLLVMCTHPLAKKALTLHLARSEGHERYCGCNLMYRKVLASSHQHLIAEAPSRQQAHLELHRLDRGARRDRTHREVTRRVRQQTDETLVDDAMPFFELGPKRQTHAPRRSRNS